MGPQPKRFSIVVGIDFTEMSMEALRVALNLAQGSGDSIVHLVHVVSANASKTESAKILVFIVKNKNAPVSSDVSAQINHE